MKKCVRCEKEKNESEFAKTDRTCKECRKALRLKKPIEVEKLFDEGTEFHISVPNGTIHCYDDSEWIVECYSLKLGKFMETIGAKEIPTIHDGRMFEVTPKQLVLFAAMIGNFPTAKINKLLVASPTK